MRTEKVRMALLKAFGIAGATLLVYGGFTALMGVSGERVAFAQSDAYLLRRIDQVENRFYGIESRLSRLEIDMRPGTVTPSITNTNDIEIQNLRSQVELLRTRLGEAECALLKLDERTLLPAERAGLKKTSATPQPCRQDASSPVKLSSRL